MLRKREYSVCASILTSIAVWILVLTVVFYLLWKRDRNSLCDLKECRDQVRKDFKEIVFPCCVDPITNCTCNATELEVACWDADANSPTLTRGIGSENTLFLTCGSGNTLLDGTSIWNIGDYARLTTDENKWFKNVAEGGTPALIHESLNFSFTPDEIFDPEIVNVTVDLFILDQVWILFHAPWLFVEGIITPIDCPAVSCAYESYPRLVSTTALPVNRRPVFGNSPHEAWAFGSNCFSTPGDDDDECGQCNAPSTIFVGTGGGAHVGRFNIRGDGFMEYHLDLGLRRLSSCNQFYQVNVMYQISP